MWLWYRWESRSYWVKCGVILESSDKSRKTSCINRSIHRQISDSLYTLSPSHHLFSYSADSLANASLIECHWVRCCQEVAASFCVTHFVLSLSYTHTTSWVSCQLSTVWCMQVGACAHLCASTHRAEGQSPCERLSAALDVLWWRSDVERWIDTHLDR